MMEYCWDGICACLKFSAKVALAFAILKLTSGEAGGHLEGNLENIWKISEATVNLTAS